jgi:hypothetical protein
MMQRSSRNKVEYRARRPLQDHLVGIALIALVVAQ